MSKPSQPDVKTSSCRRWCWLRRTVRASRGTVPQPKASATKLVNIPFSGEAQKNNREKKHIRETRRLRDGGASPSSPWCHVTLGARLRPRVPHVTPALDSPSHGSTFQKSRSTYQKSARITAFPLASKHEILV